MSAKWRRNQAWDRAFLTGPLTPVRWILTAFSSVTLAVILLVLVALYGTIASVPIGMLALIPTKIFDGIVFLLLAAVLAVPAQWLLGKALGAIWVTRQEVRFVLRLALLLASLALTIWVWSSAVWPAMAYSPAVPATNTPAHGIQFFPEFVSTYRGTVLRQLPGWEMTDVQFYGWWPFKCILLLFVLNMVVATIRRIEFKWLNIGVLSVHTGIVLISVGSIYYDYWKVEGDLFLVKNGTPKAYFYDKNQPAIYAWPASDPGRRLMVRLDHLPRYNTALAGTAYAPHVALQQGQHFQDLFHNTSLQINVAGIVPYGKPQTTWVPGGLLDTPSINVRFEKIDDADGSVTSGKPSGEVVWEHRLIAGSRNDRAAAALQSDAVTFDYLLMPPARRVDDLLTPFPSSGEHMLIVRVPDPDATGAAAPFEQHYVVNEGQDITVGQTGWTIHIDKFQEAGEGLSIITPGYKGAESSRIQISLSGPTGDTVQRSIFSQYPELTQEFVMQGDGQPPKRMAPSPAIDVSYIDASRMSFWIVQNEITDNPEFRIIQRLPGGKVTSFNVRSGESLTGNVGDKMAARLVLDGFWPHSTSRVDIVSVPTDEQEKDGRGNFTHAYLDVEIRGARSDGTEFAMHRWVPFNQYIDDDFGFNPVRVDVPEVGTVDLAFSRMQLPLPDIRVGLDQFVMDPYPGTMTPRDYISTLRVYHGQDDSTGIREVAQLNHPYRYYAPYEWSQDRNLLSNASRWLWNKAVPNQYKFSQAGWDPTHQAFTILGVGNNPGIYVIAIGGILMAIGIPIAFYVKPAILRHRKNKLQAQLIRDGVLDKDGRVIARTMTPAQVAKPQATPVSGDSAAAVAVQTHSTAIAASVNSRRPHDDRRAGNSPPQNQTALRVEEEIREETGAQRS